MNINSDRLINELVDGSRWSLSKWAELEIWLVSIPNKFYQFNYQLLTQPNDDKEMNC